MTFVTLCVGSSCHIHGSEEIIARLDAAIKAHYGIINRICGGFLILVGVCMAAGWLDKLLAVFA